MSHLHILARTGNQGIALRFRLPLKLRQFDKNADVILESCQRCDSFATQIKTAVAVDALSSSPLRLNFQLISCWTLAKRRCQSAGSPGGGREFSFSHRFYIMKSLCLKRASANCALVCEA